MNKILNVCIVGFGKLGILHSSLINVHHMVKLKAIVEPNYLIRFFLKKRLKNVNHYKNIDDILSSNEKIDFFIITTPNFTHHSLCKKILENNKSFFIEKPLCLNFNQAKQILHKERETKTYNQVGYMYRYCQTYKLVKKIIKKKLLGNIKNFKAEMYSSQVLKTVKKNWRYDKKLSGGGVLTTQNSHLIDLLYWFFGKPKSIIASTKYIYSKNVEDEVFCKFGYNDFKGNLETSWSRPGYRNLTTKLKIFFEKGNLLVDEDSLLINSKIKKGFLKKGKNNFNKAKLYEPCFYDLGGNYYSHQIEDYIKSFKDRKINNNSILDSYKVHKIIDTIYESAQYKNLIKIK